MTFIELMDKLQIPYRIAGQHHHATPGWVNIECPYCSPDTGKFKLGYNINGKYLSCWSCGSKRLSTTLGKLNRTNISPQSDYLWKVCKELSNDKIVTTLKRSGRYKPPITDRLYEESSAGVYLQSRGFNVENISKFWGIREIRSHSNLYWRLFIPILLNGREVSWTSRAISDENPYRYISARPEEELINHKDLLYGQCHVRNTCIVCEGVTDVWKIGPGAVATFGTSFTRSQVLKLSKIPVRVIVYDNEPLAQRQADKLCNLLSVFPGTTHKVVLESGNDPGNSDPNEIKELRNKFLEE